MEQIGMADIYCEEKPQCDESLRHPLCSRGDEEGQLAI